MKQLHYYIDGEPSNSPLLSQLKSKELDLYREEELKTLKEKMQTPKTQEVERDE